MRQQHRQPILLQRLDGVLEAERLRHGPSNANLERAWPATRIRADRATTSVDGSSDAPAVLSTGQLEDGVRTELELSSGPLHQIIGARSNGVGHVHLQVAVPEQVLGLGQVLAWPRFIVPSHHQLPPRSDALRSTEERAAGHVVRGRQEQRGAGRIEARLRGHQFEQWRGAASARPAVPARRPPQRGARRVAGGDADTLRDVVPGDQQEVPVEASDALRVLERGVVERACLHVVHLDAEQVLAYPAPGDPARTMIDPGSPTQDPVGGCLVDLSDQGVTHASRGVLESSAERRRERGRMALEETVESKQRLLRVRMRISPHVHVGHVRAPFTHTSWGVVGDARRQLVPGCALVPRSRRTCLF